MPTTEITDHLALELDLRVDATPDQAAFRATIEVRELALAVEVVHADLTEAMRRAAEDCALRLIELGYSVTAADVLGALEETTSPSAPPSGATVWN